MTTDALKTLKALLEAVPNISPREKDTILRICTQPQAFEEDPRTREAPAHESDIRLVTAAEAARELGTSKRMVWYLASQGMLPRIKLGTRCTRFRLRDLRRMLDKLSESSAKGTVTK
jgi:predicted DNA-binding transcriptional regulator AlpA